MISINFYKITKEFYGKAFIEFYEKSHAEDCLRLNGLEFKGKIITVNLATQKHQKKANKLKYGDYD